MMSTNGTDYFNLYIWNDNGIAKRLICSVFLCRFTLYIPHVTLGAPLVTVGWPLGLGKTCTWFEPA